MKSARSGAAIAGSLLTLCTPFLMAACGNGNSVDAGPTRTAIVPAATATAPAALPAGRYVVGEFMGILDSYQGTFKFQKVVAGKPVGEPGPSLTLESINSNIGFNTPSTGHVAERVEFFTITSGQGAPTRNDPVDCPGANLICQRVYVNSTYASLALQNLTIEVNGITPSTGLSVFNPDLPPFPKASDCHIGALNAFGSLVAGCFKYGNLAPATESDYHKWTFKIDVDGFYQMYFRATADIEPRLRGNFTAGGASSSTTSASGTVALRGRVYWQGAPATATSGTASILGRLH